MYIPNKPSIRRVFICSNGNCTATKDAYLIFNRLEELIQLHGLSGLENPYRVKCAISGCLDVCQNGPIIRILPDRVTYHKVSITALEHIFNEHILSNNVVMEYLFEKIDET
jgi:(2Fe-2S) ferredoxin